MGQKDYRACRFLTSVATMTQLPPDEGIEVAFVGRSNSGKSTTLNALTGQKSLARTSKTPGRTQLINLFEFSAERRLVDLPGYGFAKVPAKVKQQWQALLGNYLETRQCLQGLVIIMDIRHPMTDLDQQMLLWAKAAELPVHILLNKADKLKRGAQQNTLLKVRKILKATDLAATVQCFSGVEKRGIEACVTQLDQWFALAA